MIRQNEQLGFGIGRQRQVRGERNRRGGVTALRLQHDAVPVDVEIPALFGHQKTVFVVAHQDGRLLAHLTRTREPVSPSAESCTS